MTLEGKSRIVDELKPLVSAASSTLQKTVIISHFAEKLGLDVNQLQSMVRQETSTPLQAGKKDVQEAHSHTLSVKPLDPAQKRLVEFMVMNPHLFNALDARDVREVLQGGIGEIIYLQIKLLLAGGSVVEPEEILSALPEGPEKKLVSDMLLKAAQFSTFNTTEEVKKEELGELLEWLEYSKMRKLSREIDEKILSAQKNNDFKELQKVLLEKQRIEQEMRNITR
jgi:DNA primase